MPVGIYNFMAASRKINYVLYGVFNQGTDLSWILGNTGSSTPPTAVNLTSQIDNVRVAFALGGSPSSTALTEVNYNGLSLTAGVDYMVSGSTLTLLFAAPVTGDILYARYW